MKKVLIITTISGFLPQFEKNNVKLLHEAGCEIHYASNFKNPIYDFNEADLKAQGSDCIRSILPKALLNLELIFVP